MLKRKLRFCHNLRFRLFLGLTLILVIISVLKVNQKDHFLNRRHLELTKEDPISNVNCTKIIEGDLEEIQKVQLEILSVSFKKRPRLIYAPQNFYCIHVDKKSPESFFAAVKGIVSCFDNVFISSQLESVVYASWSRVQADINCMKDLYRRSSNWKYLINLCGMDFPIKTNHEIVEKLKALKGENSLETEKMPVYKEVRWKKHHEIIDGKIKNTGIDKQLPPLSTPVFSGSAYFVVSRSFVEYVLENSKILKFIEWAKDTYSPDEYLWATIQRIPEVPGAFSSSDKYDVSDMNALARFVKWQYFEGDVSKGAPYPPCSGVHIRSVCVFGVGDLSWMLRNHHLFANKFDTDVDPFAVKCLEEPTIWNIYYLEGIINGLPLAKLFCFKA
uniref:Glucosaminyl (N-acetyl) transferase 1 n=1 Tax=Malurus cyaneus samueli TaxID=2593467 RepID=A0A8C5X9Y6_9PASS